MDQYFVCCVPGSSGMFVCTVLAKYLGYTCDTVISNNGHCHDLGNGIWRSNDCIELLGDHWNGIASYSPIIFSHCTELAKIKQVMPNIKIVLINYDNSDLTTIATFRTMKAYILHWTQEEYNKVAGPDWPPYHAENLLDSHMIRNECIQFQIPYTKKWISQIDQSLVDYKINFKTICNGNLDQTVTDMLSVSKINDITKFITQYQKINSEYYMLQK
jgi:hypothetical protein